MNDQIRTALHQVVADAMHDATPTETLRRAAADTIGAKRRRRPAMVTSAVVTIFALAATGVYASSRLDGSPERTPLPDRLGPGLTTGAAASFSPVCGAKFDELLASTSPLALTPVLPVPVAEPFVVDPAAAPLLATQLRNTTSDPSSVTITQSVGIYLVQGGVVVAVPAAGAAEATTVDLAPDETQSLTGSATVSCGDADLVPAGTYDAVAVISVGLAGEEDHQVVGGPWAVEVLGVQEGTEIATATFPVPDPEARFPQCGAIVNQPVEEYQIGLGNDHDSVSPLGQTPSVTVWNATGDDLTGFVSPGPVVAVKDGVVVGHVRDMGPLDPTPFEFLREGLGEIDVTGHLEHTLCTDPSVPLPAGRYSIWSAQEITITKRVPYDENYQAGETVTTPETITAFDQVATLWMDADGQPGNTPGLAPGWPLDLDQETAFAGDQTEPETVVWLALAEHWLGWTTPGLTAVDDRLGDLGYSSSLVPFMCQPDFDALKAVTGFTPEMELEGAGIGVIFSTRAEADAFTALWEPLHGPVAGVITSPVGCHFT